MLYLLSLLCGQLTATLLRRTGLKQRKDRPIRHSLPPRKLWWTKQIIFPKNLQWKGTYFMKLCFNKLTWKSELLSVVKRTRPQLKHHGFQIRFWHSPNMISGKFLTFPSLSASFLNWVLQKNITYLLVLLAGFSNLTLWTPLSNELCTCCAFNKYSSFALCACFLIWVKKIRTGVLFLPPSDAYVRSFLYLLYTLIKLYYTKALSDQASSLAPDWILLLQGPRIPVYSRDSTTTFHSLSSWGLVRDPSGQDGS